MRELLDSNLELVVESGFIYLPLLFDPSIKKEIQTMQRPDKSQNIIKAHGKHFIKTLSLDSLIANVEKIDADSYNQSKQAGIRKYHLNPEVGSITVDGKLRKILFQVMPYFIRKNRGFERRKLSEEDLLDLIGEKIDVPEQYYEEAKTFLDLALFKKMLTAIENHDLSTEPPENGLQSSQQLRKWFHKALETQFLVREYERLKQALEMRHQFSQTSEKHIGILLYIADTGSLEIDDFGFQRLNFPDEYLVYKHTGEYELKDYYARKYRFPNCRVAVATRGHFIPKVMETYKHPFLLWHRSGQEICMGDFYPPSEFSPENIISTLEAGINALLYGYDSRRRNGYHSLDKTTRLVETVEFGEYVV
ncbi:MAG: hypothetical protein JRG75_11005 [Deltaproteobacteria bacterium]|nr:hypothetical protein [Deltaproteobacteria bacterium]